MMKEFQILEGVVEVVVMKYYYLLNMNNFDLILPILGVEVVEEVN
jgi:hypothetical protein